MSINRRSFIHGLSSLAVLPSLSSFASAEDTKEGNHVVMSCNIRVALDEDEAKGLGWSARKRICLEVIERQKPDIICLQEVLRIQANDFRSYFKGFQLLGFDGPEMDAHATGYHGIAKNPILLSVKKYELLTAGTFWLSETPLVAGSKSWDTARARQANWVRLRDRKSGKDFRVINLHLDHVSAQAKTEQLRMVVEEAKQYQPDFPQLLTGDFNSRFDSPVLQSARAAGWKEAFESLQGIKEAGFTGHEFQGEQHSKGPAKGRIDYIWCRGNCAATSFDIIRDQIDGKYPSDHFFIKSEIRLA